MREAVHSLPNNQRRFLGVPIQRIQLLNPQHQYLTHLAKIKRRREEQSKSIDLQRQFFFQLKVANTRKDPPADRYHHDRFEDLRAGVGFKQGKSYQWQGLPKIIDHFQEN